MTGVPDLDATAKSAISMSMTWAHSRDLHNENPKRCYSNMSEVHKSFSRMPCAMHRNAISDNAQASAAPGANIEQLQRHSHVAAVHNIVFLHMFVRYQGCPVG